MNRIKDLTTAMWLIAVYIFVSVDALLQTIHFGAWMTLVFPIAGFVALSRLWDIYGVMKGLFGGGDTVVMVMSKDEYQEVLNEVEKRKSSGIERVYSESGLGNKSNTSESKGLDESRSDETKDDSSL